MEKVRTVCMVIIFLTSSLYSMVPSIDPNQILDLAKQQQSSVQAQPLQAPEQRLEREKTKTLPEKTDENLIAAQQGEDTALGSGIDTVNIEDGGNWLLKRKAVEDTIDLIEQINRQFSLILETRIDYRIKQNQLDSEYDKFIADIGFDIGESEKMLTDLIGKVESERTKQGDLTEQERALLEKLNQKQKELTGLKETISLLQALEIRVNEVLAVVDNQIKKANEQQNQAWRNFQDIKQVLSDEKAEDLYYQTNGLYKNLQEIYAYLKTTLSAYFNEQFQAIREQMNKVKNGVQNLSEVGIDLKKEFERLELIDAQKDEKRASEQLQIEVEKRVENALSTIKKDEKHIGWFGYVWNLIAALLASIARVFSDSWFFMSSFWGTQEVKIIMRDTQHSSQ